MNENDPQKCGLVAVLGAPNAGKSTLVNILVGQKVAIVSAKAQTTRTRLMGVAMEGMTQILLVDTPGIFSATKRFERAMVQAAWGGAEGADILALVVDASKALSNKVLAIIEALKERREPCLLLLNKVDVADKGKLLTLTSKLNSLHDFQETFYISAAQGEGIAKLKAHLAGLMPEAPWHYDEDQVSDASERALCAEITREQIFRQLHEELPYACVVETELFKEMPNGAYEIHQQIKVNRTSQRAIILGKGGAQLKSIGAEARGEMMEVLGRKVHLYLHVKLDAKWQENKHTYAEIGLDWVE
jgi:GTPase